MRLRVASSMPETAASKTGAVVAVVAGAVEGGDVGLVRSRTGPPLEEHAATSSVTSKMNRRTS
jgi:hypothetical protein